MKNKNQATAKAVRNGIEYEQLRLWTEGKKMKMIAKSHLEDVTKEELYYCLLMMVYQSFYEKKTGYLEPAGNPVYLYVDEILSRIIEWNGEIGCMDIEIERVKNFLQHEGLETLN